MAGAVRGVRVAGLGVGHGASRSCGDSRPEARCAMPTGRTQAGIRRKTCAGRTRSTTARRARISRDGVEDRRRTGA